MPDTVWVALVTGAFGVVVAMIHTARRENHQDHAKVERILGRIEGKLDSHIDDEGRHV
jgi:phosphoribosylpyrophosphate synthetase